MAITDRPSKFTMSSSSSICQDRASVPPAYCWRGECLRDLPLALGQLTRPPAAELEHGVQPVHQHRHKPEEGGGPELRAVGTLQRGVLIVESGDWDL